jgi:hypothetical protein
MIFPYSMTHLLPDGIVIVTPELIVISPVDEADLPAVIV